MSEAAGPDGAAASDDGRPLRGRGRLLLVAAAGLVPWVVIPYDAGASLVFSFGLVNPVPLSLEPVHRYVFVDTGPLPRSLLVWPTATLLYAASVLSAALSVVDREDRRVTTGLLALAGANVLFFAVSFSSRSVRVIALPVGVAVLWLAAWASRPTTWRRF